MLLRNGAEASQVVCFVSVLNHPCPVLVFPIIVLPRIYTR